MLAIELMAFSSKGDPMTRPIEIIDDIREFSSILFAFLAIIVTLLSLTLGGTFMVNTVRHLTIKKTILIYFRQSLRAFWNILETVLDQENYSPKQKFRRMIWLFLVIGIFLIVGYYANMMHTNMVSDVWPPTIDRISDFFTDRFKSVDVFMFKSLWFYDILHDSDHGSDLRRLYDKLKTNNCSMANNRYCGFYKLVFGVLKMTQLAKYLANFITSRQGSIITADVSMKIARTGICSFEPKMWRHLHHTQSLASGTVAFFGSIDGDRDYQRFVDIREKMTVIESGIFMKQLSETSLDIFERLFQQSPGVTYYQCTDNVPDDVIVEPELKFGALRTFLILITICFTISTFFLLAEKLSSIGRTRSGVNRKTGPSRGLNKSNKKSKTLFKSRTRPSPIIDKAKNIRTKRLVAHTTNEMKKSLTLKVAPN